MLEELGAVFRALSCCMYKSFCTVFFESAGRATSPEQYWTVHEALCDA